ncbi:MAG: hypothetical protein ABSG04_01020 [Verrucomicrobiota bacterium]|jgi:hypothetical protein
MPDADPVPPPPSQPPKKHGCFFYGCITSLILVLVLAVGLFFGVRYGLSRLNRLVAQYSDTSPVPLPVVQLPPQEMQAVLDRITAFSDALDAHSNTAPLILTGEQVNALLASRPELAVFKGKFFVSFEGEQAKAQISLPLESLPKLPMVDTAGRYLNGSGTFRLAITNGILSVILTSLEVKGQSASPAFLAAFQNNNLAQNANNPSNAAVFNQIESLQVTNGSLVIQAKSN